MALAIGTSTTKSQRSVASLTYAHDATGADMLIIGAGERKYATAATYNGVSATALTRADNVAAQARQFYLPSPTTGSNNIVVTFDSAGSCQSGATNFSGASATIGSEAQSTGTSANITGGSITAASGDIIIDYASHGNGTPNTVDGSQTQQYQVAQDNTMLCSTKGGSGSSTNMSWTSGTISLWASCSVVVQAASTPPSQNSAFFGLM